MRKIFLTSVSFSMYSLRALMLLAPCSRERAWKSSSDLVRAGQYFINSWSDDILRLLIPESTLDAAAFRSDSVSTAIVSFDSYGAPLMVSQIATATLVKSMDCIEWPHWLQEDCRFWIFMFLLLFFSCVLTCSYSVDCLCDSVMCDWRIATNRTWPWKYTETGRIHYKTQRMCRHS